jgi:uncharacterized membrane protein YebE (DUF533 family)
MFDARSILDILLGGPGPQRRPGAPPAEAERFRDLLGQLGKQEGAPRQAPPTPTPQEAPTGPTTTRIPVERTGPGPGQGGPTLEELLRQILSQQGGQTAPVIVRQIPPGQLQDLLRELLRGGAGGEQQPGPQRLVGETSGAGGTQSRGGETSAPQAGQIDEASILEALKRALGQATEGVREGATRIDEATGASGKAREAIGEATGKTPEELIAQLRELATRNKLATGAALGGLGALLLGTRAGRSLASTAVRLGGLALIGGLAYKALQNYQQGKPILPGKAEQPPALAAAPDGSGFEPGAVSDEAAQRYIRTMIAAAAADGRIDAAEQRKILGSLRQAGLADAAQQFLAAEIGNPATPAELASGVTSSEEAVQVYTAARIAIDLDSNEEHVFLSELAAALGIDEELAAQVDATARATAG